MGLGHHSLLDHLLVLRIRTHIRIVHHRQDTPEKPVSIHLAQFNNANLCRLGPILRLSLRIAEQGVYKGGVVQERPEFGLT